MIFNLFKSKPTLKELIPDGFVDIHSHILPGIDDGAKNVKESTELISEMKKLGFSKIIATPHTYSGLYENDIASISKSYNELMNKIDADIEILYASEYMIDHNFLNLLNNDKLLTLNDRNILIEMSYLSKPINLSEIIFKIKVKEYTPIIAHPERYLFLSKNIKYLKYLKRCGCLFQLNLLSVTGYYGKQVRKFSEYLIDNDFIDFCGSDIHNIKHILSFNKHIEIGSIKKLEKIISKNMEFFVS